MNYVKMSLIIIKMDNVFDDDTIIQYLYVLYTMLFNQHIRSDYKKLS
mgnify:CR=1 FL=1